MVARGERAEDPESVLLRLLQVRRGPDGWPPTSNVCLPTTKGNTVGRAGFDDQDAITLNGKKL